MTQSVSNLRVRRTQKLLREALIALIEERGFDALTIGELTERAMVSRAAFYRNYQDKYDLVDVLRAYRRIRTVVSRAAWQERQPLVCAQVACGACGPDQRARTASARS